MPRKAPGWRNAFKRPSYSPDGLQAKEDACLSASENCICAGAESTCGQPCSDGSSPRNIFNVTASGHVGGTFIGFENSVSRSVISTFNLNFSSNLTVPLAS